ncbi:MAG TPA: sodium:proton antiporter [Treponema sp.]|nr:sodium:proton antiporter [Treponema sp.]
MNNTVDIARQLAIIVIFAKAFGLIARKLKAPQVAGEIVAGLIIGPSLFGWVKASDFLGGMAEIGVIMLMFNAGLTTNIKDLKKSGLKATLIACAGVFLPLVCGTILFMAFYGFEPIGSPQFYRALFIGTILTATSVSITVQALKELGKLSSFVGTTIVSAAIIDDVLGIIVLTFVIGLTPNSGAASESSSSPVLKIIISTILFFALAIILGIVFYKVFKIYEKKHKHTRRIPIVGLALAFSLAYVAQRFFGVADITGAYIAGVILCATDDSSYISRKMDVNSYMLFGPVFFCSIGLQTNIRTLDMSILLFTLAFVAVGMISKVLGCGLTARACKFNTSDSLKIGCGMMTRGEVALIVAQRGLAAGILDHAYFTAVIVLIIVSSITTPIALKAIYHHDEKKSPVALDSQATAGV